MRLSLWFSLLVWAGALNGTANAGVADYSRAESLAKRTEGKVFRDAVAPHWLPDNRHFWYRVTTGPEAHEYVLVDAQNGEIRRADSAAKLGVTEGERVATSAQRSLAPRRTTHTGGETAIRMSNVTTAAAPPVMTARIHSPSPPETL